MLERREKPVSPQLLQKKANTFVIKFERAGDQLHFEDVRLPIQRGDTAHPISLPSRPRWNSSPRLRMQQSRRSARVRRSVSFVVSAAASSRAVGATFGSDDVVAAVTSFGLRPRALRLPSI
jgi:hypothetical protein